jgi:hypothetical protein
MIEGEAKKSGRSLNQEMVYRLMLSFQLSDIGEIIRAAIDGKLKRRKPNWDEGFR